MPPPSSPDGRGGSPLDALLVLSRSLPLAKQDALLPDALDVLLSGIGCARGVAYRARGGALEIAGERGLSRPLRATLEKLPLDGAPWFAAQRAAAERRLVADRRPAATAKGALDRVAMSLAQWAHVVACPIADRDLYGVLVFTWTEGEDEPSPPALAVVEIACGMIAAHLSRRAAEPPRAPAKAGGARVVRASALGILASAFAEDLDARLAAIERPGAPGEQARAVAAVRRSAARFLAALTPAPHAPVDVVALADDVLALTAPHMRRRGIAVSLDAVGPHAVVARRADLMQLLLDLVLGAAGALDDAGATGSDPHALVPRGFRLEVRRRARHVIVSLRDDDAGARASFFDIAPPARLDLDAARRIALAHEGRLDVEPDARAPDGGPAHFTLALPAVGDDVERRAAMPTVPRSALAAAARRVVVWIDADDLFLEIMVRSLPEIDVRTAGSGAEAMQLFAFGVVPALVLCNLDLPDVSGDDLRDEIARRSPDLAARFVFVSNGAAPPEIAARLAASGSPTLARPIDVDQVRALAQREPANLHRPAAAIAAAADAGAQTLPDPRQVQLVRRAGDSAPPGRPALREQELAFAARTLAEALRRDGPKPGAAVGAMLRDRGLSHAETLSVLSFALSKGILVRDPPPGALLRAPDPSTRTVLVVDDDDDLRETVREILEDEGYRVETAANGREALRRLLGEEPPRVLVLDLMMPVMDGWQILEELDRNASLSWIPVVVISASNARLSGVRAPRVHEFMSKPLDYHKLVTTIDRSMRARAGAA